MPIQRFAGAALIACCTGLARADLINGDFEDGLGGWTVVSGQFVTAPLPNGDHVAVSSSGGRLRQDFLLPAGAQALTFVFFYQVTGPGGPTGPADFLNFYLLDPATGDPLIPPAPGFEGASLFFGQDPGGTYGFNTDYVTLSEPDADGFRSITASLGHLPAGQPVWLEFGSFEFSGNGYDALFALDDVTITVPEPAGGFALLVLGALAARRR